MAEPKTRKTKASVSRFLAGIEDPQRRADAKALNRIMREATGERPVMWGESIVGFGSYHYVYASGREGDWMLSGYSPRKSNLVVYVMAGFSRYGALLERLGKHKTGKACLYLKRLSDVDLDVLRELVQRSAEHMRTHQACAETKSKAETKTKSKAKTKTKSKAKTKTKSKAKKKARR